MKTRNYYFDLPDELIAQHPSDRRSDSRLLILNRKEERIEHRYTRDLPEILEPPMVLVRNNSRVRKARIYGEKTSGGRPVEFLFIAQKDPFHWETIASRSKRQRIGHRYCFPSGLEGEIVAQRTADGSVLKLLRTDRPIDESYFDQYGHMPLPPYIKREDDAADEQRYQTIYASETGSVAAPTAGLHMTKEMEASLFEKGVEIADITLHVGLGTFLPIRTEEIEDHRMHEETYTIDEKAAGSLNRAKETGKPILAVGTTSMRTLESACENGRFSPGTRSTDLYITPGYQFKAVDMLLTNFHTPGSTLVVLVSAFAGKDRLFQAYQEAVEKRYRFYSYGDAMLII